LCIRDSNCFALLFRLIKPDIYRQDSWLRFGLVICGCYGAYSLGANNVANSAMVFTGPEKGMLPVELAVLLGGLFISLGTITYSKNVMMTVGKGIVQLDAFSAFVSVLAHSITLHLFAEIGVPVSSSQAVVGSVIGISLIKGLHLINYKTLVMVFSGWTATPFIGALLALLINHLLK
jgi:PiT family inorganic phosphate transporter